MRVRSLWLYYFQRTLCDSALEACVALRWRLILAVLGLALVCLAGASLVYGWWPLGVNREDFRPPPTLFAPPAAVAPGWEPA
jgi:hypothetical protein